jgi:2-(3-amino-3-carboxypropyl)histidine synthase
MTDEQPTALTTTADSSNSINNSQQLIMQPKRIIRRRRAEPSSSEPAMDTALLHQVLAQSNLPTAYSFEIPKTCTRIQSLKASSVALQMPEGLLLYATVLSDIFKRLCPTLHTVCVLGDVTYGACCVDDLGARALGCELLIHYGHSCLVPLQHTVVPCLYVFVEIQMDVPHMAECLAQTITVKDIPICLLGTIQFRHAFANAVMLLQEMGFTNVTIPQVKPLSAGEVLGCTSPKLRDDSIVCFVADGRFHLESTMISNPSCTFYRYDPYTKCLTTETYNHEQMKTLRLSAIQKARSAHSFGIILGTLGRQGNPAIVQRLRAALSKAGKRHFLMLLSEITPEKLRLLPSLDAWVQVACPRLSVDWGHYFSDKPVLNPYELFCCLEPSEWKDEYPMDYYSQTGGPWSNYHETNKERKLECDCATDTDKSCQSVAVVNGS